MVCACEDVGLAHPQIIPIVKSACDAALMVGLPEARIPLADAVTLADVQEKGEALLRPLDSLFRDRPSYTLATARQEALCRNGNPFTVAQPLPEGEYRVYDREGQFLCLSRLQGGVMTSVKNFFGA